MARQSSAKARTAVRIRSRPQPNFRTPCYPSDCKGFCLSRGQYRGQNSSISPLFRLFALLTELASKHSLLQDRRTLIDYQRCVNNFVSISLAHWTSIVEMRWFIDFQFGLQALVQADKQAIPR